MLNANFNGEAIVPVNNNNPSLFDSQPINAAMDKRRSDPRIRSERAQPGATSTSSSSRTSAAIPWFWDKTANIEASNVQGVIAKWNAAWDLSYISLK